MKKRIVIALSLLALTACDQPAKEAEATVSKTADAIATPPVIKEDAGYVATNRTGKVIFELHCAGCHDPGDAHAATKQLAIVRGEDLAVIRQRKDLVPPYIKYIVRDGLLEMPPFRPTDINDSELDNLANYIVESANAYTPEENK